MNSSPSFRRPVEHGHASFLLGLALAAGAFALTFEWSFLLGSGPYWEQASEDVPTHLAGLRYFLAEPWHFPIFDMRSLGYPQGSSVIFTDSIPLMALPAKLLADATGASFNYLGLWFLLCWLLQPVSAIYALRGAGVRGFIPEAAVAALSLSVPAWLARFDHAALCAHFLILIALGLYLRARRFSVRAFIGIWALFLCAALLIHPYLFFMCGGLFGASCLARFDYSLRSAAIIAVSMVSVLAAIFLTMFVSGHLAGGGAATGFGHFSMNLLSPVWPQKSGLLPGFEGVIDATGGQYEGFNYLGAGILCLTAAALILGRGGFKSFLSNHWALISVLSMFFLLALSHRVFIGDFQLTVFRQVPAFLEQLRASGRFFWPIAYALLIGAVAILALKLTSRKLLLCLSGAVLLQFIDASLLYRDVAHTARLGGDAGIELQTWQALIDSHESVHVVPSFPCSSGQVARKVISIVFAASASVTPINTVYTARNPHVECVDEIDRLPLHDRSANTLVVLFNPAHVLVMGGGGEKACRTFDGIIACSANWAELDPRLAGRFEKPSFEGFGLDAGDPVSFRGEANRHFLLGGWSGPEPWAVWSEGGKASLFFELPATGTDHLLCFELTPFLGQNVTVTARGEKLAEWKLSGGVTRETVVVSSRQGRFVHLELAIDNPTSPASLGRSNDTRRLGIALSEIALVEDRSACQAAG